MSMDVVDCAALRDRRAVIAGNIAEVNAGAWIQSCGLSWVAPSAHFASNGCVGGAAAWGAPAAAEAAADAAAAAEALQVSMGVSVRTDCWLLPRAALDGALCTPGAWLKQ